MFLYFSMNTFCCEIRKNESSCILIRLRALSGITLAIVGWNIIILRPFSVTRYKEINFPLDFKKYRNQKITTYLLPLVLALKRIQLAHALKSFSKQRSVSTVFNESSCFVRFPLEFYGSNISNI